MGNYYEEVSAELLWASKDNLPFITSGITAAIIVIGSEVLSGRTKEGNINFIAKNLNEIGIDTLEARIIPDNKNDIITAIKSVIDKYNYIFTTGGIGPTHDDITTESLAEALNLDLELNKNAVLELKKYYLKRNVKELNVMHLKMALLPKGAEIICNDIAGVCGFSVKNIFVLAGIPILMQATFLKILPTLKTDSIVYSKELTWNGDEVDIAKELKVIQDQHLNVYIGIYPKAENFLDVNIVLKSYDKNELSIVYDSIQRLIK